MGYRITGLAADQFKHLYGLPDEDLVRFRARRYRVDTKPGFPDRIEMRDAELGETVLLVNFTHQPAENPYRASHAVFILEGATNACDVVDMVPKVLKIRTLSVRAFDAQDEMIDADVVEGEVLEGAIHRFFASDAVCYLHVHYAKRGCFAAKIERA